MGLTLCSSAPSLGMDMNTPVSITAGIHKPVGMGMATPDSTTIRMDQLEDAFRKQSMDSVASLCQALPNRMIAVEVWAPTGVSTCAKSVQQNLHMQ